MNLTIFFYGHVLYHNMLLYQIRLSKQWQTILSHLILVDGKKIWLIKFSWFNGKRWEGVAVFLLMFFPFSRMLHIRLSKFYIFKHIVILFSMDQLWIVFCSKSSFLVSSSLIIMLIVAYEFITHGFFHSYPAIRANKANPPIMPAVMTPGGPLDLSSVLFRNRIIFIGQPINSQVAQRVISQLVTLATIDEKADILVWLCS